jgi:hypothetical protein
MRRKIQKEKYVPVEEWTSAPDRFKGLNLGEGEYTIIVDPQTGMGLYLVARLRNIVCYHTYLDGVEFKERLKRITMIELQERAKENEKFL